MSAKEFAVGITTSSYVMLDYDKKSIREVRREAERLMREFSLYGYAIYESSTRHYHAVFTRKLNWKHVCAVLRASDADAYQKDEKLRRRRCNLTLRVLGNSKKPEPRLVVWAGKFPVWFDEFSWLIRAAYESAAEL